MNEQRTLIWTTMLLASVWSLPAVAQSDQAESGGFTLEEVQPAEEAKPVLLNSVEAGIGYSSKDSFKFGEYNGHEEEGVFGIGSLTILGRDPYDGESTRYYKAFGTNLGLDNRNLDLIYGHQGKFRISIDYNQIPHNRTERGRSPYLGIGSQNLTLPPGWVAAPATTGMTILQASLRKVDIETERKRFGTNLSWNVDRHWTVSAGYHREYKDGLDTIGGAFGTNGGNPSAIILPQPIDYITDKFDVGVAYAGRRAQFQLGYHGSLFQNRDSTLRFQNPYSMQFSGAAWAAATGFPTGFGQMQLPPDNQAHNVTFMGGYNFGETSRLMLNVSWSRMLQDENFLNYTAIPALAATIVTPLPRTSLDGQVDNIVVDLRGTTRPMPKLDLNARYRFEFMDNSTPQNFYVFISGDAESQPGGGVADEEARVNLPYSLEKHIADLGAGYRLLPWLKASANYKFELVHRDFQERDESREHSFTGKLSGNPFEFLGGWLKYTYSFRDGSTYVHNQPHLSGHTLACFLAANCGPFENNPFVRKYYLNSRDGHSVRAGLAIMPHEKITVGLDAGYTTYSYDNAVIGLTNDSELSATIDVSYSPLENVTTHGFFTYEELDYSQRNFSWGGGNPAVPITAARSWQEDSDETVYTAGVGVKWNVIKDTLDIGADYTFSLATTDFSIRSQLAFLPFPHLTSQLHSFGVKLDYKIRDNLTARLGYRYEMFSSQDFQLDNVGPTTIGRVLPLGEGSPDYNAHVFGASLIVRF